MTNLHWGPSLFTATFPDIHRVTAARPAVAASIRRAGP